MDEILKKLNERDRGTIERTLEMLKREEKDLPYMEHMCESLRWRIYGMADILLAHRTITEDEYIVLSNASNW